MLDRSDGTELCAARGVGHVLGRRESAFRAQAEGDPFAARVQDHAYRDARMEAFALKGDVLSDGAGAVVHRDSKSETFFSSSLIRFRRSGSFRSAAWVRIS